MIVRSHHAFRRLQSGVAPLGSPAHSRGPTEPASLTGTGCRSRFAPCDRTISTRRRRRRSSGSCCGLLREIDADEHGLEAIAARPLGDAGALWWRRIVAHQQQQLLLALVLDQLAKRKPAAERDIVELRLV